MKKIIVYAILLALFISCSPFSVQAQPQDDTAVQSGCTSLRAQLPLAGTSKLLPTAKAVILYELNSDTLVYAWNPDMQIDPTGMVKLMTALVALEEGNLEDTVTVTRQALDSVAIGAVSAELKRGEELLLMDLLYCVMVASANDACAVIAEHIGGTQEAFVQKMNDKAASLGCTGTHFVNPHGLSQQGQYSTARDLAIITEAALENALFASMFCEKTYTVPATNQSEARVLNTTNHMMSTATLKNYLDERVTGGKPAAASTTDRSMICTASQDEANYLCVIMSASGQVTEDGLSVINFGNFEETKALLDHSFQNYALRQVLDADQPFAQYAVSNGENDVVLHAQQDVFAVLPKDAKIQDLYFSDYVDANGLTAPIAKDQMLGTLRISYGNIVLRSCALIASYSVAQKGTTIQPAEPIEVDTMPGWLNWQLLMWIGLGILIAVVTTVVILLLIRVLRSAKIRAVYRRRRRARRRSR